MPFKWITQPYKFQVKLSQTTQLNGRKPHWIRHDLPHNPPWKARTKHLAHPVNKEIHCQHLPVVQDLRLQHQWDFDPTVQETQKRRTVRRQHHLPLQVHHRYLGRTSQKGLHRQQTHLKRSPRPHGRLRRQSDPHQQNAPQGIVISHLLTLSQPRISKLTLKKLCHQRQTKIQRRPKTSQSNLRNGNGKM